MTDYQARGGFDYSHFFNYERLQGILGDPYRLRPYLDEYTAGNYDRMLGELAGGVQGGPIRRTRP
jgi:hypothetical protein